MDNQKIFSKPGIAHMVTTPMDSFNMLSTPKKLHKRCDSGTVSWVNTVSSYMYARNMHIYHYVKWSNLTKE